MRTRRTVERKTNGPNGGRIENRVHEIIGDQIGNRDNAQYLPPLAAKLMKDIGHFPLWSCVVRDKFGYGRVPASSAAVESEFNKLKTLLLRNETLPMRVDDFLDVHIKYTTGRAKILGAKLREIEQPQENCTEMADNCNRSFEENNNVDPEQDAHQCRVEEEAVNIAAKKVQCPACQNGDLPSGAHKCVICNTAVHALDCCSKAADDADEGYGQKRVCLSCYSAKSTDMILATRHEEGWGGELAERDRPSKKQKPAKYLGLQKHKVKEQLHFGQNKKLLTIKNGSHQSLHAQTIDGKKVYVIFTCPFDSLYQVVLAALCDRSDLRRMVSKF